MGTSMLQRSQTTSSHIKVINKNSSSAELQSLCKLHHESAKKREEARGYSTAIGVFEGAGGGIFLRLPPNATAAAPKFCNIFAAQRFLNLLNGLAGTLSEGELARLRAAPGRVRPARREARTPPTCRPSFWRPPAVLGVYTHGYVGTCFPAYPWVGRPCPRGR